MTKYAYYPTLGRNGRLGNQLFQIAATYAYAKQTGRVAQFPAWDYLSDFPNCRTLDFAIPSPHAEAVVVRESAFSFAPLPNPNQHVILDGYFQSEKYFMDYRDEILHLFDLGYGYKFHGAEKSISVHVRRGDYEDNPSTRAYHGLLPLEWYYSAIERIKPSDDAAIFVFSDCIDRVEAEWDSTRIKAGRVLFVSAGEIETLKLMTQCKYNVIANSSFSWWGHWLNRIPDKVAVAPAEWFKNGPKDTQDIYTKTMIVL